MKTILWILYLIFSGTVALAEITIQQLNEAYQALSQESATPTLDKLQILQYVANIAEYVNSKTSTLNFIIQNDQLVKIAPILFARL